MYVHALKKGCESSIYRKVLDNDTVSSCLVGTFKPLIDVSRQLL